MTIKDFQYIVSIHEFKNVTKAANALYISQAALSQSLNKIESEVGMLLFNRTKDGLSLTLAGERYVYYAYSILKLCNDLENEFSDMSGLKRGKLNVGFPTYVGTSILPKILPTYKEKYPNIDINIVDNTSLELERLIIEGQIDASLLYLPIYSDNLEVLELQSEQMYLAVPHGHEINQHAYYNENLNEWMIDLTLCKDEDFILTKPKQKTRQISDLIFQRANIVPKVVLTLKSIETAKRLCASGMGLTIIPSSIRNDFRSSNEPKYYRIEERYKPYRQLAVVYKKNTYLSKATMEFINVIKNELK